MSNQIIVAASKTEYTLPPTIIWSDVDQIRLRFAASCLRQSKITYNYGKLVNIYIVCEIVNAYSNEKYPTLENALFGAVKLTKNTDINKYRYSGCGFGLDGRGFFWHLDGGTRKNVIIFGADMSSSVHTDNKKDIVILGKGPTQGLCEHSLTAEKCIRLILPKIIQNFVWAYIVMEKIAICLLMEQKFIILK